MRKRQRGIPVFARRLPVLAALAAAALSAAGEPAEIDRAKAIYEEESAKYDAACRAAREAAVMDYGRGLAALAAQLQQAGDFDGTMAVRETLRRFQAAREVGDPAEPAADKRVLELRRRALDAQRAAEDARRRNLLLLTQRYAVRLKSAIEAATRRGDFEAAGAFSREGKRIEFVLTDMETSAPPAPPAAPPVAPAFANRLPPERDRALARYYGTPATELAVVRALRWLQAQQGEDGSWNYVQPAMTGFALLAFLAHGEQPGDGPFGDTVSRAVEFLVSRQDETGRFQGRDGHDYAQPIAAFALCEAYGMTRSESILAAAKKAVAVVTAGQNPGGGFNYNLVPSTRNDLSYTAWCVQALKAADRAGVGGVEVGNALQRAIAGVRANYSGDRARGGFGYTAPGRTGLTAAGVVCLQLLGEGRSDEVRGAMVTLADTTCNWQAGGVFNTVYYWYYTTHAMFNAGALPWARWNRNFSQTLVRNQIVERAASRDDPGVLVEVGYWAPPREVSGHTDSEGRVMNTCLCTLMLETYYRYAGE